MEGHGPGLANAHGATAIRHLIAAALALLLVPAAGAARVVALEGGALEGVAGRAQAAVDVAVYRDGTFQAVPHQWLGETTALRIVIDADVVLTAPLELSIAGEDQLDSEAFERDDLLRWAGEGEGLGNKFLANIRETDAIAHVVRCFEDDNVIHVSNSVNPRRDIETIDLELIFADLESCEKQLQRVARNAKGGDKEAVAQKALLEQLIPHFEEGKPARSLLKNLSPEERQLAKGFPLLTNKPVMYNI